MIEMSCGGSVCVFGDNHLVLYKATMPGSTLKKSMSRAYNLVIEGVAREKWGASCANANEN